MKKTVILLAALLMLLSFASCSGTIKSGEAKEQIRNYFDAVEEKNYALADTFLHPDSAIESEVFFGELESKRNFDCSNIEIERYTGFSTKLYLSTVSGTTYSLKMDAIIGDEPVALEVQLVKNRNGFGINSIHIRF